MTKYHMWQRFNLPVLKVMYIVNSCLANPDNKSVSHSTICNTITSYEHLGVWLYSNYA